MNMKKKLAIILVVGIGLGIFLYFLASYLTLKGMAIVCEPGKFDLRCLMLRISPEPLSLPSNCKWVYTLSLDCYRWPYGACAEDFEFHCGTALGKTYPEVTHCELKKYGYGNKLLFSKTMKYCNSYTVPAYSDANWVLKAYKCEEECECTSWEDVGCGVSPCSASEMKQVRDCNPPGCDDEVRCVSRSECVSTPEGVLDLIFKGVLSIYGG